MHVGQPLHQAEVHRVRLPPEEDQQLARVFVELHSAAELAFCAGLDHDGRQILVRILPVSVDHAAAADRQRIVHQLPEEVGIVVGVHTDQLEVVGGHAKECRVALDVFEVVRVLGELDGVAGDENPVAVDGVGHVFRFLILERS